jgi:hypothetical protein
VFEDQPDGRQFAVSGGPSLIQVQLSLTVRHNSLRHELDGVKVVVKAIGAPDVELASLLTGDDVLETSSSMVELCWACKSAHLIIRGKKVKTGAKFNRDSLAPKRSTRREDRTDLSCYQVRWVLKPLLETLGLPTYVQSHKLPCF